MHRSWKVGVVALGALFFLVSTASATIIEALSLAELVQEADHVVLVTCIDEHALRDSRRRIVTDFDLRVEDVIEGPSAIGSHLTMRRIGGAIGDLGMRIEGEPHLVVGERYLVFLRQLPSGTLRPVGMSQGVMPIQAPTASAPAMVIPGGGGLALRQRGPAGQLAPAPAALLHPEPYEQLRPRLEGLVQRQGASQ